MTSDTWDDELGLQVNTIHCRIKASHSCGSVLLGKGAWDDSLPDLEDRIRDLL